ncbi:tyrosine-type recombinase/integrase [Nocardioides bigeumensis]|uniref:Site-specific integrase n=1 Tax=Nocardioides bigeumensis TaxID=433657 RepID=A0ABP5J883_9ACTN
MAGRAGHRGFGSIRRLKSKRWQASYVGQDGERHSAPTTFFAKPDAEAWLANERLRLNSGAWSSPVERKEVVAARAVTFEKYATTFMVDRTLKPKTREHYESLLRKHLHPTFGALPVKAITPYVVKAWHTPYADRTPTLRSHAYGLLRTILGEAVHDGVIPANPCHIRGAGNAKRVHKIKPASLAELEAITTAMPERYRLMVLLAAWCGLRFGELTELRRRDVDVKGGVLHIRRGVTRVGGEYVIGTPKTDAGTRDVSIPPHLLPVVREHLTSNITGGRDGLLFPATDGVSHMASSSLYKVFYRARSLAGRDDLRFHDLRHTGAVLAASTGATLAELMARLGHSTAGAALRYQHASQDRDKVIAEALSALVQQR